MTSPQLDYLQALGFALALAIGFLIGRTREEANTAPRNKPGIRDCLLAALLGGVAGVVANPMLAAAIFVAAAAVAITFRSMMTERSGLTSELAFLLTFWLGYLCLTGHQVLAAALAIIVTVFLDQKQVLRDFTVRTISEREFGDTLKFLALIFIILPLLPTGSYGPFDFFNPRQIWFFVILVSSVSFVGYFLMKFLDPQTGLFLGAVCGGLASTTAYTAGASKAARESPEHARVFARCTLLANAVLFPRLLILLAASSRDLMMACLPMVGVMAAVAITLFFLAGGFKRSQAASDVSAEGTFRNPFSFWPAMRFGLLFALILLVTKAANHYWGGGVQWLAALLGGLLDLDAILLSTGQLVSQNAVSVKMGMMSVALATIANGIVKSVFAVTSAPAAFWAWVVPGLVMSGVAGLLWAWLLG